MATSHTEIGAGDMADQSTDQRRGGARRTAWILIAVAAAVYLGFVGSAVLR